MGWGVTRKRVYDLFLWLTRQALADREIRAQNCVRDHPLTTLSNRLIGMAASEWSSRQVDRRDDQATGCGSDCQGHAWTSFCKCIPSSYGMTQLLQLVSSI
jgi:hypothetical protein